MDVLTPPMGQAPEWTGDPRFATLPARVENREALDTALSEWTSNLTPKQVMTMLQRHGVPASAVQTTEDVYFDGHLRGRGYVVDIQHPEPQWGQLGHATFGRSSRRRRVRSGWGLPRSDRTMTTYSASCWRWTNPKWRGCVKTACSPDRSDRATTQTLGVRDSSEN